MPLLRIISKLFRPKPLHVSALAFAQIGRPKPKSNGVRLAHGAEGHTSAAHRHTSLEVENTSECISFTACSQLGKACTFTYRSTCTSARIAQGSPFTRGAASCDGFAHPVSTSAFAHSSNSRSLPHGFDSIALAPTAEWPCSVAPKVFPPTGLGSCC